VVAGFKVRIAIMTKNVRSAFSGALDPARFGVGWVKSFLKVGIAEGGSRDDARPGDLVHRGIMMNNRVSVVVPWRIEEGTHLGVVLHDRRLVGSTEHFLRFDFYPHFAPSHPERHFAYWEIPLSLLGQEKIELIFRDGRLIVLSDRSPTDLRPRWKGKRDILGYCTLTVSLWHRSGGEPQQIETRTSRHVVLRDGLDLPLESMQVAVSQRCNLKCPFCTREQGARLDEVDLPPEVLAGVLEASTYVPFVGLQGIGEPLMNPDVFRIATEIRKRMPAWGRLALTTNGTLLNRDAAKRLIDGGINTITFSVDGATKFVYEGKRVGANFEKVIANIRQAVEYGRSTERKDLWLAANFIVMNDNVAEVPAFVRLAATLGLDAISFYRAREYPSERLVPVEDGAVASAVAEATALALEHRININFADPKLSKQGVCFFMQSVYLWLSGEVLPCHRMEPPGHPWPVRIFGNLRDASLMEIWNSPEYKEFRRKLVRGTLQDVCRGCTHCSSVVV
jgi:radical SAM protein with 4Fe4S-binding SPASM domain